MDNDVKVAALGEAVLGGGKGFPIVYYVTISTGIGGALVIDQKVISGQNGHAGEIGNICIDRNREKYNILNAGAVENEASGTAITRKGRELFGEQIAHAGNVFELARTGDEKALKLVDDMAYDLAMMFSAIGHILNPQCICRRRRCYERKRCIFRENGTLLSFDNLTRVCSLLYSRKLF